MATRIFYKFNAPEKELEFVKWTPRNLVVKFPPDSKRAGEDWLMGRGLVNRWLEEEVLRIEGEIPDWALVV